MKKKNICVITSTYPDFPGNNRGIFIRNLMDEFEGIVSYFVVTPKIFKKSLYYEKFKNQTVSRFWFPSGEKLLVDYNRIPYIRMLVYLISGFVKTLSIARKNKCSLIEAHFIVPTGLIGLAVARFLRLPLIIVVHGGDITVTDAGMSILHHPLLSKIIKYVVHRADFIIANSEFAKSSVVEVGAKSSDIEIAWEGGVDTSLFKPAHDKRLLREKYGVAGDKPVIIFVGSLIKRKGVDILIEAFLRLRKDEHECQLLFVGEGGLRGELEKVVSSQGLQKDVKFMGQIPHSRIAELYSLSDIFVLPSNEESMGCVVLEAMSSGLALVGSRVGGIKDIIGENQNGLLFKPGDVSDLTRCLRSLIIDNKLRKNLGVKARQKIIDVFSRNIQVKKINEIYNHLKRKNK